MQRGFTLIEMIIYIALFSLIIGGTMASVYELFQASAQTNSKATVQDEENFVLRKIAWALNGSKNIPAFAGHPSSITIPRYDANTVIFRLVTVSGRKVIQMNESGGTFYPITTDNVTVNGLTFTYVTPILPGPAGITASTTINGLDASSTKYIRQ